jgi:hypothetical protein
MRILPIGFADRRHPPVMKGNNRAALIVGLQRRR